MDSSPHQRTQAYIIARYQHPAWQLLASRRAPLVLSCLQTLFEQSHDGVALEDALQNLANMLAQHANHPEFDIESDDFAKLARQELRGWIKRELVIEREGRLYATDALEEALRFVEALGGRIMTSSASRLSVVQREIESLEANLNPDPKSRVRHIRRKIEELERDLEAANAGDIHVLGEAEAVEGIREIYNLAISLRADFRRVEDSWREADRRLRQSIISEQNHRGTIVDKLLDGHDDLLETPEGRVFQGFQLQLGRSLDLDHMKLRLRIILRHPVADIALTRQQQTELRWLTMRLVKESAVVIQARARSERDVKGFLKTGLAAEHHRVGGLLADIFQAALEMNWGSSTLRYRSAPMPPVAIALGSLPLVERLRFKSADQDEEESLELSQQHVDLNQIEDDFWQSFDGLDREALLRDTLALLAAKGEAMSIAELARHLPPSHDLETLALWLSMAREAELPITEAKEVVDIVDSEGLYLRFQVPAVQMSAVALQDIKWEL